MVEMENVEVEVDGRRLLTVSRLSLDERRVAVIGENGSGKSTFSRLINGLRLPTRGHVKTCGYDTRTHPREVRKHVGMVFQNADSQIVFPIVEEDVAFGPRNHGFSKDAALRAASDALALLGLEALSKRQTHLLSGGEKQLVALAGVLAMRPHLIILDEPTTLLDLRNRTRVARAVDELTASVLVVTHDLDLVSDFDRALVFRDGRIVIDDTPTPAIARYVHDMTT